MSGPPVGTVFQTSDGYRLVFQQDRTWTDGDLTFNSNDVGLPVDDTDGSPLDGTLLSALGIPSGSVKTVLSEPAPALEEFVSELRRLTEEVRLPVSTSRLVQFEVPNLDCLSLCPDDVIEASRVLLLLAEYAALKAQAMRQRIAGNVEDALRIESNLDKIYRYELPQWARW